MRSRDIHTPRRRCVLVERVPGEVREIRDAVGAGRSVQEVHVPVRGHIRQGVQIGCGAVGWIPFDTARSLTQMTGTVVFVPHKQWIVRELGQSRYVKVAIPVMGCSSKTILPDKTG